MAKNYDIKTASKRLATSVQTVALGGVVATGMTRYVTFLRISPLTVRATEGTKVYFCSGTLSAGASDALATASQKLVTYIASTVGSGTATNRSESIPTTPDTEHPLFTIASGAYMTAHLSSVGIADGSAQVFAQYFDE